MSDRTHRTFERHCDVAIVGGSEAGLAAALTLARQGLAVIVVDRGGPLTESLAERREAVRSNGGEICAGRALEVTGDDHGRLRVHLTGGHAVAASLVLSDADLVGGLPAGLVDRAAAERQASANETDWDQRYSGEQLWSGNPNGTLVNEVSGLPAGRALDVGAGEGGDAVWLAEQGWQVTANDVSSRALERVQAEARRRGLTIETCHADANAADPFGGATYDLVTAHYASIPRRADDRAISNLVAAVAPGGLLLVVGHDLTPMRAPIDTAAASRPFDPDAYVRVDDVAAAIAGDADWDIEVNEVRPRPPGAVSHHVDDVVLRARRHAH